MPDEIDTTNRYLVAARGDEVVIMRPPLAPLSKEEALSLAAWLVAIADDGDRFAEVLQAVQST